MCELEFQGLASKMFGLLLLLLAEAGTVAAEIAAVAAELEARILLQLVASKNASIRAKILSCSLFHFPSSSG